MTCHAHCCAIEGTFDRRTARREIEAYRRKGPSASTRTLLTSIEHAAPPGADVLDIGGGVGVIAHELLERGAAHATLVDASAAYLEAAREEAERRDRGTRLTRMHGDVVALASGLPRVPIVTLDKVVCCYPDLRQLLATSTSLADHLYGIVYPREGGWVRAATAASTSRGSLPSESWNACALP